uniref:Uncharacterized protein n=1 Tax=Meloidogyne enterolobii TaxID=390850 RepID=A0A6V7V5Y7_MELEN|nr:unnamed protein product [Meloidogyne enterolobii]
MNVDEEEKKQINEMFPIKFINIKIESGIIPEELIKNGEKLEELIKDQRYIVKLLHVKLDENKKVLPGGRLIGTEITQKYDTITFVLPNELAESMEVYVEPNTGLYKYRKIINFQFMFLKVLLILRVTLRLLLKFLFFKIYIRLNRTIRSKALYICQRPK